VEQLRDTTGDIFERIRSTYDGPLSLAEDFMVWNVTRDTIRVRMAVVEEHTWSPALASPPDMADRAAMSQRLGWEIGYSDFVRNGAFDVDDVLRPIYEEAGRVLGREFPYPERNR
jgi:ribonuclease Z